MLKRKTGALMQAFGHRVAYKHSASIPMLWRRVSHKGTSNLEIITPLELQRSNVCRMLLVLPGGSTNHDPAAEIQSDKLKIRVSGYLKRVEFLLGETSNTVPIDLFALSYASSRAEIKSQLDSSNKNPTSFASNESRAFVSAYITPFLDGATVDQIRTIFRRLSFFSISFGAGFARQIEVVLQKELIAQGIGARDADSLVGEITLVASSNVSRAFDTKSLFTVFYFMSCADKVAEEFIGKEKFQQLMLWVTINPCGVICLGNKHFIVLHRDLGTTVTLIKPKPNDHILVEKKQDPTGHTSDLYVLRRNENRDFHDILKSVLTHAIQRKKLIDTDGVKFAKPVPNRVSFFDLRNEQEAFHEPHDISSLGMAKK